MQKTEVSPARIRIREGDSPGKGTASAKALGGNMLVFLVGQKRLVCLGCGGKGREKLEIKLGRQPGLTQVSEDNGEVFSFFISQYEKPCVCQSRPIGVSALLRVEKVSSQGLQQSTFSLTSDV